MLLLWDQLTPLCSIPGLGRGWGQGWGRGRGQVLLGVLTDGSLWSGSAKSFTEQPQMMFHTKQIHSLSRPIVSAAPGRKKLPPTADIGTPNCPTEVLGVHGVQERGCARGCAVPRAVPRAAQQG